MSLALKICVRQPIKLAINSIRKQFRATENIRENIEYSNSRIESITGCNVTSIEYNHATQPSYF